MTILVYGDEGNDNDERINKVATLSHTVCALDGWLGLITDPCIYHVDIERHWNIFPYFILVLHIYPIMEKTNLII